MCRTVCGVDSLAVVVPRPNCPYVFLPQHCTELSTNTAHVLRPPAAINEAVPANVTRAGYAESPDADPNCPRPFPPQHHTVPSVASTQLCVLPATICDGIRAPLKAVTRMGTGLSDTDIMPAPFPSWPKVLSPQHHIVLSFVIAHVCESPRATRPVASTEEICTEACTGPARD